MQHIFSQLSIPRRLLFCAVLLLVGALVLLAAPAPARATPLERSPGQHDLRDLMVVRIHFATPREKRDLLARGLDILEAHHPDELVVLLFPDERDTLVAEGWEVEVDTEQTARLQHDSQVQSFPEGYRTVEEVEQFLNDMAASYPSLAALESFGVSWDHHRTSGEEGYELLALRITNQATPGPKPIFFLMATIHARELTTTEIATRFISHLLENYGTDAQVTYLLDEHEIVVVPMANPDGRKLAEQGYYQRKNTNATTGTCQLPPALSNQYGVDLNRNFSYQWGNNQGSSNNPCNELYRGSVPASEPETRALQEYITALYPDRVPPTEETPAPLGSDGLFISLHSYSELVLWPWGYTYAPAPNAEGLAQLGQRLASFNGYDPRQASRLYTAAGITEDWVYGILGIPSYTFEIGPGGGSCGGFMPPFSCLDEAAGGGFWERNLPALCYAAQAARAPYTLPAGPDVHSIEFAQSSDVFTVTAVLSGSEQIVAAAEVYLSHSPWSDGVPRMLQPVDGSFDTPDETAQLVLSGAEIAAAPRHASINTTHTITSTSEPILVLARAQNEEGVWGPLKASWLETTPQLSRVLLPLIAAPVKGQTHSLKDFAWMQQNRPALRHE
jgi:hypothetical protein